MALSLVNVLLVSLGVVFIIMMMLILALLFHMFYYDLTFRFYYDRAILLYNMAVYSIEVADRMNQYQRDADEFRRVLARRVSGAREPTRPPPPVTYSDLATRFLETVLVVTLSILLCGFGYEFYYTAKDATGTAKQD